MFRSFVVSLAVIAFVASSPTFKAFQDGRIVGGFDVDIEEAPYQISLQYRGRHSCGGSIIANDLILTAAHCVLGSHPSEFQIRAGSSSFRNGGSTIQVSEIVAHPDFNIAKMDNDVALIQLATPLAFDDKIAAIDLIATDVELDEGAITTVTGWGSLREGSGIPDTLQMVQIPVVSETACYRAYQPYYDITARMLCAGYPDGGKDACQGDSGGPLVYDGKLAGVVSWGLGCARPSYPGVYAKVSALRSWIDTNSVFLRAKSILRARLH